eukprot:15484594-Alexandrium_andersonii.AAC.1
MSASLVGSEMCIRDSLQEAPPPTWPAPVLRRWHRQEGYLLEGHGGQGVGRDQAEGLKGALCSFGFVRVGRVPYLAYSFIRVLFPYLSLRSFSPLLLYSFSTLLFAFR